MRNPLLRLPLALGRRLRRELEHGCFLTFKQVGQHHDLPVGKFERVVMGSRLFLVDLSEDGRCVIELGCLPAKQPAGYTLYLAGKGELRSGKNTNCGTDVFRGANPRVPVLKLWVVNLSPTLAGRDFTLCKL